MPDDTDPARERQLTRDPDTIEEWAREHDVVPVRTASDDEGERFRMVPENELREEDERLEWEAFADELEGGEQVVIYHGDEASEPLEVSGHQDAIGHLDDEELEERLLEGETVTSTITETRVVESVEDRVVDAELLNLECTRCDLETVEDQDVADWFDTERYLDAVAGVHQGSPGTMTGAGTADTTGTTGTAETDAGTAETDTQMEGTGPGTTEADTQMEGTNADTTATDTQMEGTDARTTDTTAGTTDAGAAPTGTGDDTTGSRTRLTDAASGSIDPDDVFPYRADLEVEETWTVTREFMAEHTVESTITGHEVTEADTLEDYDLEASDLHRTILDQGVFGEERPSDELLTHYDAESEVAGDDTIHTTFSGTRRVEDEIVDRKRLSAEVAGGEYLGMDLMTTRDLAAPGFEGEEGTASTGTATTGTGTARTELSEDVVGNTVVNAAGDDIGVVSDVDPETDAMYVDVDAGITEKIKTALGWGDADEDDYQLGVQEIAGIDDDTVRLKGQEEIDEGDRR